MSANLSALSAVVEQLEQKVVPEGVDALHSIVESASNEIGDWRRSLRSGATSDLEKKLVMAMETVTDAWLALGPLPCKISLVALLSGQPI